MATAAPPLSSEIILGQLADRLFAVYAEAIECEERSIDLSSAQRLVGQMLLKLGRDFLALVTTLHRNDPFLDWWIDFEAELKLALEQLYPKTRTVIGTSDIVGVVRSLVLTLVRQTKKDWPVKAVQISAKLKEYDSRRLIAGAR